MALQSRNLRWMGIEVYLGVRVAQIQNGKIRIVQGDMELEVCLLERVVLLQDMNHRNAG